MSEISIVQMIKLGTWVTLIDMREDILMDLMVFKEGIV